MHVLISQGRYILVASILYNTYASYMRALLPSLTDPMVHVVESDHPHIRNALTFSIVSPECHYVKLYTVYEQHKNRQSSV